MIPVSRIAGAALLVASFVSPTLAIEWISFGFTDRIGPAVLYALPMGNDTSSATQARYECTVPVNDAVDQICVYLSAAPGVGLSRTITLMNGASATDVAVTITHPATSGCDTGLASFAAQTDEMSVKSAGTLGAANAVVAFTLRHHTAKSTSWLCGNSGDVALSAASTFYWTFSGTHELSDVVEYNGETLMAVGGTFKNMCMHMVTAPGVGNTMKYRMRKEGADTSGPTEVTLTGASDVDGCDTTNTFTASAGDGVDMASIPSGGTPADTYGTWSIAFDPSKGTQYNVPVSVRDNFNPAATEYMVAWGGEQDYGTEAASQQRVVTKMRLLTLYTEINTIGPCTSWNITLRQNGASTALATQHSAANVQSDTSDITVATGDLLNYMAAGVVCGAGGGPTVHATLAVEGRKRRIW